MRFRSLAAGLIFLFVVAVPLATSADSASPEYGAKDRWSQKRANDWYASQPWLVGSNFIPSTAINELEMWQADTFDLATIDRELGWAQNIGMNTMRVFLHNLAWKQDPAGFLGSHGQISGRRGQTPHSHHVCVARFGVGSESANRQAARAEAAHAQFRLGAGARRGDSEKSRELVDGNRAVHQGGRGALWRRSARRDLGFDERARQRKRDQYRSTELPNKAEVAAQLLAKVWVWARSAKPSQPLTSGVWKKLDFSDDSKLSAMEKLQLENSDVITFHNYDPPEKMTAEIQSLRHFHRPVICTEYMARPHGSTFETVLPVLHKEDVGAYNWGFVAGKTNTIFAWDSWEKEYPDEPPLWFHDIFRGDGTPYNAKETELILKLTRTPLPSR